MIEIIENIKWTQVAHRATCKANTKGKEYKKEEKKKRESLRNNNKVVLEDKVLKATKKYRNTAGFSS